MTYPEWVAILDELLIWCGRYPDDEQAPREIIRRMVGLGIGSVRVGERVFEYPKQRLRVREI